mgnify:CR=1 FL=1
MTEERKYSRRRVLKAVPMAALGLSAGMGNASGRTTRSRVSQQASGRRSVANTSIQGGWSQQVKLTPDDGDPIDSFGSSVTLDGARALVGAYGDEDPNGDDAGSAYVFERTNGSWTQQAKLTPDDGDAGDYFGVTVALDGGMALVGAYGDEDPNGDAAGSAYVFERSTGSWTQQAKLTPDDGDAEDLFGDAVALDGATALVGAPWDEDPNGDAAGSAYVFERTNGSWTQQAKLIPDDGDADDLFGDAVALDGDRALVGANGDEGPNGDYAGSAYVFERSNGSWAQQAKLTPDDRDRRDSFGDSVVLDGGTALVGANGDEDPNGANAGSAYVFEEGGTTGAGVPDRVYDAVAGTDGQLERDDVISMVRGYAQSGSVNGVDIDRDEVLSLVRYYVG